jgi:hypothetical protein
MTEDDERSVPLLGDVHRDAVARDRPVLDRHANILPLGAATTVP